MGMSRDAVKKIFDKKIEELQQIADQQKVKDKKLQDTIVKVSAWDKVPDHVNDETLTNLFIILQTNPGAAAKLKPEFLKDFQSRFVPDLAKKNQRRLAMIVNKSREQITGGQKRVKPFDIAVAMEAPKKEGGAWTVVAVPVKMGKDFKVVAADVLQSDLQISMDVIPHENKPMTEKFNIRAQNTPAGKKVVPLVVSYKEEGAGPKFVHVSGHLMKDNKIGLLDAVVPLQEDSGSTKPSSAKPGAPKP